MAQDGIYVELEGLEELQAALKEFTVKDLLTCVDKGLRAGAKVQQAEIIEQAPYKKEATGGVLEDGELKGDIAVKKRVSRIGSPYYVVGPTKKTGFVAAWLEDGHRLVRGGRSRVNAKGKASGPGKQIGTVDPIPFIRTGFEVAEAEAIHVATSTMLDEIEKTIAKKAK